MGNQIQIVSIVGSVGLLLFVFKLLRDQRLKEEYSLLWLVIVFGFLVVSSFRGALEVFAQLMGVYYPPAALFLVLILGCYLMLMHFSLVFSKLTKKNVELAQELGLLRMEVENLRRSQPEAIDAPPALDSAKH